jgi:hypothetical protein
MLENVRFGNWHTQEICGFAICVLTIVTCVFAICGHAHRINLRLCDSRISPRICGFAMGRLKYKSACPPLAILKKKQKFTLIFFRTVQSQIFLFQPSAHRHLRKWNIHLVGLSFNDHALSPRIWGGGPLMRRSMGRGRTTMSILTRRCNQRRMTDHESKDKARIFWKMTEFNDLIQ